MLSVSAPLSSSRSSSISGFSPALAPIEEDRVLKTPYLDQPLSPRTGLFTKLAIELELRLTSSAEAKAKATLAKAEKADHDARRTGDAGKQAKALSKLASAMGKHQKLLAEKQNLVRLAAYLG